MNYLAWRPTDNTHIIPIHSIHTQALVHIQALAQDTTGQAMRLCLTQQMCQLLEQLELEDPRTGHGGYSNHMGPGNYSAQYMSESHLQQKWEDPAQLAQYEQEMVGRLEAGASPAPGSSQYMDSNMLGHSQTPCHQPSTPSYTSPHHQPHPPNPAPSPLMYPQSHLHYPQPSPSPSPYMEKCSPMPHCYKGYNIPPNSQYGRQLSSHSSLKQGAYRSTPNSYGYQQPTPRGYEQQTSLQAMTNPQESHPKYQHYNQPQQNYCLSELPVRSPEQYYQTCSPSSSHSPARSVGRSPSYSSTPSPLMTNPESFQYGQPPMTPGAASSSSSSSAGMQDQASVNTMLMPPRSHPSPSISHTASHSYTTTPQAPTMKERFSEKLLSNPSLWSLNALTSQVENISNNVQQLLLSEALVANKKGSKRSSGGSNSSIGSGASTKKGEEYKSPPYSDSGGNMSGGPMHEPYSTPQHQPLPMELHEGGYSSSSDEPLDRGYYYFGQGRSPAQAHNNTQLSLDTASSCSIASPDDMSTRSGDSGLHNLTPDPIRCQAGQGGDGMSTPAKSIGDERSPTSITIPTTTATDASTKESAIGDTVPQPQSAMPIFSALNDKAAPPAQARDHIDHSDAKVLEPDSPQLPGKSILPSAPSWADTPPSPQKGDDDIEPGISCASAVTPLTKPEPMVPSAQPRTYGRKYARGRRRMMHSGVVLRRQLSLQKEEEKVAEETNSSTQKTNMSPSKTILFSDQTNLAHQDSIVSQTPKVLTDGFQSRMSRPFNRNSKLSFCPYVRINNSRDFSSWCAIVNKPEDAVVFQRRRKKGILRMRNPFTVAKVVPHTAAMQLGPLVNTNLSDKRPTCCLCGKPPNYKDLGDLCGPYYTEDSIPRKILTITHAQFFREDTNKIDRNHSSSSEEPGTSSKTEDTVNSDKEGNTEPSSEEAGNSRQHHRHYRRLVRPERPCQEGGPRRLTLRERFRRMNQLQNICTVASKDQEDNESTFQRLQMEAVAKQHWAHENCTIWTKGIIMVAGRLYGLKEAASKSAQTVC
ncbi:hypothetical protein GOODEAATRI_000674 [Goodea atripinnis]|uniref:Retinoic acid induced 1 n=1 Tax=Goodea atripinnis TaxID=208336 RepID=A0ABV0MEB0_9TELE